MKRLLLIVFLCVFTSAGLMAQQNDRVSNNNRTTKVKKSKKANNGISKNGAVIRINEVASGRGSNRSTRQVARNRKRIVETNSTQRNSMRKVSHREMIAKRKKITDNY